MCAERPKRADTHSSQVHFKHSQAQEQITCYITKQVSVNLRRQIISSIFSNHNGMKQIKLQEKNWKKYKYMEVKQHPTKQLMGQQRNQSGNQTIPEIN